MVVHVYGQASNMDKIVEISKNTMCQLLRISAQSHGDLL